PVLDDSLLERQPRVSVPGMHLVLRREPAFEQGGLRIIRSLSEMLRVGHLFSLTDRTELPLGTHSSGLIELRSRTCAVRENLDRHGHRIAVTRALVQRAL